MYGLSKIEEQIKQTNPELQIYQFGLDPHECGLNIEGKQ